MEDVLSIKVHSSEPQFSLERTLILSLERTLILLLKWNLLKQVSCLVGWDNQSQYSKKYTFLSKMCLVPYL